MWGWGGVSEGTVGGGGGLNSVVGFASHGAQGRSWAFILRAAEGFWPGGHRE